MKRIPPHRRNQLWLARKRLGLGQKQVAYLLKHKTTDQVSRYEQGARLPGLKLLLQLEIIYGLPPRLLYRAYYEQLQAEIAERNAQHATLGKTNALPLIEAKRLVEFCAYEELLQHPRLSAGENARLRKHVVLLVRRLSEKQPPDA